jgi:hypothetical protein
MKIWCRDFRDEFYTDASMRDVTRYRGIAFMLGRRVGDRFPSGAIIDLRSEKPPTDFFMAGAFPVISAKLKSVLDSFSVQGEFLPVKLAASDGDAEGGDWYCFNATDVIDCLDRELSIFTPEKDFATKIKRLIIRDELCDQSPLVLAAKTIPYLIIVRDELSQRIVETGCTGVVFKDACEWRDPVYPADLR